MEFIKLKCMACGWEWRMGFPFGACDVIVKNVIVGSLFLKKMLSY